MFIIIVVYSSFIILNYGFLYVLNLILCICYFCIYYFKFVYLIYVLILCICYFSFYYFKFVYLIYVLILCIDFIYLCLLFLN